MSPYGIILVEGKYFLKDGGIHWDTCSLDGKGNNSFTSFDKKAIHVANKREYVASLMPNLTQTSNASSPCLSWISTAKI